VFVIPEIFIGNPVFFKNKEFWIPAYAGMTAKVICQRLLQEPLSISSSPGVPPKTGTIYR